MKFTKPNPEGRLNRAIKREAKQANYIANGLNGPKAVARRKRKIQ
jgi:hypothetical protein